MRNVGNREAGLISIKLHRRVPLVDVPSLISDKGISGASLRTRGQLAGHSWGIVANYGRSAFLLFPSASFDRYFVSLYRDEIFRSERIVLMINRLDQ